MEKLRRMVNQIAYTHSSRWLSQLSPLQLSLIPLLSLASTIYRVALSVRHLLYRHALFKTRRLPVPVVSVGNLTWGGNGKTPMVEFLAYWMASSGISPLILTRGYGGSDEAKMLQRHLSETTAKIGVGANRFATAVNFLGRYGYLNAAYFRRSLIAEETGTHLGGDKIGVAILDDGMQHLGLWRDVEILLVNGMMPWGNNQMLPLGPLREPLSSLARADVIVIHHADMVSRKDIEAIESAIRRVKQSLPIFFTTMAPLYFLRARNMTCKLPLGEVHNAILLCVSAIGYSDSFVQTVAKMGALHVDRIDFSDHHLFQHEDINQIRTRLQRLQVKFAAKPIVVVTEKDYDRSPDVYEQLDPYEVLVLCSKLQIVPYNETTEDSFKKCLRQQFDVRYHA